jgi:hypothetical protein
MTNQTNIDTPKVGDRVLKGSGRTVYVVTEVYDSGNLSIARESSDPRTRTSQIVAPWQVHS